MKCPICNGELARDKETGAVFCCNCNTVFRNEAVLQTVNVKGGDISEIGNSEKANVVSNVFETNGKTVSDNSISSERAKDDESGLSNKDNEIDELKARLAKLEKDKQNSGLNKFKQAMTPVVEFLKKWGLKAVLPAVLIFITFVTLLSCLAGLRGIYVNVDDPNEFYSFTAGKYQSYSEFGTEVLCEKGSWNKSGNKLTLKIKDEDFGNNSDDLSFKKLDGYDLIEIEGSKYKRVSIICYKDTIKKATVTFDSQGGSSVNPIKNKIGSKIKEFSKPVKLGYDFTGWYTAPQGSENAEPVSLTDRIWEDVTYYAHWNVNATLADYDFVANGTGVTIQKYNNQTATNVIIPDIVTKIDENAFSDCEKLTCITIPETVTSIASGAFSGCSNLMICVKATTKPSGWDSNWNPDNCHVYWGFVDAADCLIFNSINDDMAYEIVGIKESYKTKNISFIIPNVYNMRSVTSICEGAFRNCSALTNITISSNVTSIGEGAFSNCRGLTSIFIPSSITSIGSYAFSGCSNLTIYVQAATKPSGWDSEWNANCSVVWGFVEATDCLLFNLINGGTAYEISGIEESYRTKDISFIIPNVYKAKRVTSIGLYAFYGCSGLKSITIPNSVTSIGSSAFYGCSGLTGITIPNGVASIGSYAFNGCSKLTSVTIPSGVTSIGSSAFSGCRGLTSITIPEGVTSIGYDAFNGCGGLTSITIPNSVTSIGVSAFSGCSGLTSLTIPNSVTSIGNSTFYGCSGLTRITIPSGVTSIGSSAFNGCSGLTNITIPDGVTSIGDDAFNDCSGLTSITTPAEHLSTSKLPLTTIKSLNITKGKIPDEALKGCTNLTSLTISNGITSIGNSAFSGCSGLTSLTIPNSVTSIGDSAFYGCSGLTSITIPDSVTSIGGSAFYGCSSLTRITIPSGVTSIGSSAFSGCSGLTSITISNGVASIGSYAFNGCSKLTSITTPAEYLSEFSLTNIKSLNITKGKIPYEALKGCTNLTSLTIGEGVTSIGDSAFSGCSGLTNITIPNSVTSIGGWAFYNCSNLTSITIPNSVTSIGKYAFCGCNSLTRIMIFDNVSYIGDYAFSGCSNLTICAEAATKPDGWSSYWNYSNCPVVWGYNG